MAPRSTPAPQVTEASLTALPRTLGAGYANRGVYESITEARRQLDFGNAKFAARWASRAELLAGAITQDEFNARCDALHAAS